jgi:hypothetical protein
MTGFAKRPKADSTQPKLLSLYQSWLRIYALRLHPELEQLWQLDDIFREEPEQSFSRCLKDITKLTSLIRNDARHLLLAPDFKGFVEKLKRVSPCQPWEPKATRLSVPSEPKRWLMRNLDEPLQLEYFQLLSELGIDEDKEAFVACSYELTVTWGEFEVNLVEIECGNVYSEPLRFARSPFKEQQEAIAEQLAAASLEQGGLSLRLMEEVSCLTCYAALAFALEARIDSFQEEAGVELESQFEAEIF